MATLQAIRVKNLRSLKDTGWIEQRAITVLVGKNSAGKSTYARLFPLLRQSVTSIRSSPILWFGQLVDFGQFSSSVHGRDQSSEIELGFRLRLQPEEIENEPIFSSVPSSRWRPESYALQVDVTIVLGAGGAEEAPDTIARRLIVESEGFLASLIFDAAGNLERVNVDNKQEWIAKENEICHVTYNSALPNLSFLREQDSSDDENPGEHRYFEDYDPFAVQLIRSVRKKVHGNLGEEKIRELASRLIFSPNETFVRRAISAGLHSRTWTDYIRRGKTSPDLLEPLKRSVFVAKLTNIITAIDKALTRQFSAVRYVEPLRATTQRYYRKQDLAIDEIDPNGGNVAQFLQSLPPWQKLDFDEFSRRLYGFKVQPRIQAGHIELLIEQAEGAPLVNMADAGVGFSQMLPILLQVWSAIGGKGFAGSRYRNAQELYLVVEQPELHLHPAYQATLADVFCEVAVSSSRKRRSKAVIETHSPALINRLGGLVASGRVSPDEVQILIFQTDSFGGMTQIEQATFDRDGGLNNWPFGFFEPEV